MGGVHQAREESSLPEDYLRLALEAPSAQKRARYARVGLALAEQALCPDTRVLLLRQLYLSQLERRQLAHACRTAAQMAAIGPLKDVAFHDQARALAADGDLGGALAAQRLAARNAPPERRSFQLWSLATLQHFAGETAAALRTLDRAMRWASEDAALLRAHRAYVLLDAGEVPAHLQQTMAALRSPRARRGYGDFLLGMIAHLSGDPRLAATHLRVFLRRNAAADVAKLLTLQEELRRARTVLARLESV